MWKSAEITLVMRWSLSPSETEFALSRWLRTLEILHCFNPIRNWNYFKLNFSPYDACLLYFCFGGWLSHWVMSDSCDPTDCSLPCSSVHGILQARILEWVAISFSMHSPKYLHLHSDWWGRGEPWQGKRDFLSDYQTVSKRNKLTILYSSLH